MLTKSGGGRSAVDIATAVLLPTIALLELVDGEYRPLAAAAAGTTFGTNRPLDFSVDPADLLDDEASTEEDALRGDG